MRLRSNWSIIRAAMKQLIGRKVISERHGGERFLQQFEFHALRNSNCCKSRAPPCRSNIFSLYVDFFQS